MKRPSPGQIARLIGLAIIIGIVVYAMMQKQQAVVAVPGLRWACPVCKARNFSRLGIEAAGTRLPSASQCWSCSAPALLVSK